jgi:hypothetical protein
MVLEALFDYFFRRRTKNFRGKGFFKEMSKVAEELPFIVFSCEEDKVLKRCMLIINMMNLRLKSFKDVESMEEFKEALEFVAEEKERLQKNGKVVERRRQVIDPTIILLKKSEDPKYYLTVEELVGLRDMLLLLEEDMRRVFTEWIIVVSRRFCVLV